MTDTTNCPPLAAKYDSPKEVPVIFVENVLKFENGEWEDGRLYRRDLAPGSACWNDRNLAFDFVCPCGCATVHVLPTCTGVKKDKAWLWDGNVEKPTLSPSIQCTTPCKWHGYLKAGVFQQC